MQHLWQRALADLEVFCFGDDKQAGMCFTLDEHDAANPVKRLPDRPHLRMMSELWQQSQQLEVAKSRQMMLSWFVLAAIAWEVLHPGRRWLVVCKKFESADRLLDRIWHVLQNIPAPLRPKMDRKQGSITIHHGLAKSYVTACAQDSDDPRSMTYSGIFVDEGAFTDHLEDLFAAAKPTTMAGGKLAIVSSPNGRGFFYHILSDGGRLAF